MFSGLCRSTGHFSSRSVAGLFIALLGVASLAPLTAYSQNGQAGLPAETDGAQMQGEGSQEPFSITGTFRVRWSCPPPDAVVDLEETHEIFDESSGAARKLQIDETLMDNFDGVLKLNGKRLVVVGIKDSTDPEDIKYIVSSVGLAPGETLAAPPLTGSQPQLNILVRFSDYTPTTPGDNVTPDPMPVSYFTDALGGGISQAGCLLACSLIQHN